jgi:hypothetical protein
MRFRLTKTTKWVPKPKNPNDYTGDENIPIGADVSGTDENEIEINTLEELLALGRRVKTELIIDADPVEGEYLPSIEIYNGWRE